MENIHIEIMETLTKLKKAKEYLRRTQEKFSDNPDLLRFYEPSAKQIVRQYELRLKELINQASGSQFEIHDESEDVDLWVKLEGKHFEDGSGPISVVGTFLQKLNSASQHIISLLEEKITTRKNLSRMPVFSLVETASGSLKLGLRKAEYLNFDDDNVEQLDLFPQDPWERIKEIHQQQEKVIQGFKLLVKALDAVQKDNLQEIYKELPNDNSVIKLLHFAKDVTPSSQSPIERIEFVGNIVDIPTRSVIVDKNTRKLLHQKAKSLKHGTEYVEGKAIIRQQDIDYLTITARPLFVGDKQYDEVKCKFPPSVSEAEIDNYLKKLVKICGFLIYGRNNQISHLEIDEITIEDDLENEE